MKISINEPCHENWDKMTPNAKGAFCLSCQKNVVDFSSKTIAEIKDFFNELPSSNNVCGRFKENQLNDLSFDHFLNEFMAWKFVKKMAVIFFLSLGSAVFTGCSSPIEDKHMVGELEVVPDTALVTKKTQDTVEENMMMLGDPIIVKDNVKKEEKCEADSAKNKIGKPKHVHMMGGPMVTRDTINHKK